MASFSALSSEELAERIDTPIGTPTLETLGQNKNSACIVIDDISRPTPGDFILPVIIGKLIKAGIPKNKIRILLALGAHRPMTLEDMEKKVGKEVLDMIEVINHSPFSEDLVTVENSGQIIKINKIYHESDIKILVGCIVPHTLAGFSGGAKNLIPGVGGIETLESNHKNAYVDESASKTFKSNTLNPDNPMRQNMEKIAEKCGVDFIVNVVMNDKLQVADAFAGHFVKAHREACKRAKEIYHVELVPNADIVILNAYPKDTEYSQIGTAFSVLAKHKKECFNDNSTLILTTAASEGAGYHGLFGPGMRLFTPHEDNTPPPELKHVDTCIFSTGVKDVHIRQFYDKSHVPVYNDWQDLIDKLHHKYSHARVAIYPMASMQIGRLDKSDSI